MSQMVGTGAQVSRGGPGAAPGREVGVGAAGARGSPGAVLSREAGARATGTCGSPRATLDSGGGSRCLDLMLICEGTRSSGYRQLRDIIASLHDFMVDVGFYPQAMEHVHHVLGGNITSGALCVWTGSKA
jgi:hypothetical protein